MAKKKGREFTRETPFSDAMARFTRTNPRELAEAIAANVVEIEERTRMRIKEARKEIEDGARPRRGRFRL